jgi:hypothetical protein
MHDGLFRYWRDPFGSKATTLSQLDSSSVYDQRRRRRNDQRNLAAQLTNVTGYFIDAATGINSCTLAEAIDQPETGKNCYIEWSFAHVHCFISVPLP